MTGLRGVTRVVLWGGCGYHLVLLVERLARGATGPAAESLLWLAVLTTWASLLPVVERWLDARHALAEAQLGIARQVAAGLVESHVTVTSVTPPPRSPGPRVN